MCVCLPVRGQFLGWFSYHVGTGARFSGLAASTPPSEPYCQSYNTQNSRTTSGWTRQAFMYLEVPVFLPWGSDKATLEKERPGGPHRKHPTLSCDHGGLRSMRADAHSGFPSLPLCYCKVQCRGGKTTHGSSSFNRLPAKQLSCHKLQNPGPNTRILSTINFSFQTV